MVDRPVIILEVLMIFFIFSFKKLNFVTGDLFKVCRHIHCTHSVNKQVLEFQIYNFGGFL